MGLPLEGLVLREEASTLSAVCFLEMAAAVASRIGQALPADDRQKPGFNLEKALARCAEQAEDHETELPSSLLSCKSGWEETPRFKHA